jgi:uncharacterized protein (TIGR02996 family)
VSDEDAFRKGIQATPEDDTLRGAFADWLDERDRHEEATAQRNWRKSVAWLKKFVGRDGIGDGDEYEYTFDEFLDYIRRQVEDGGTEINFGPAEGVMYELAENDRSSRDFWRHFGIVTGFVVPEDDQGNHSYSCAC